MLQNLQCYCTSLVHQKGKNNRNKMFRSIKVIMNRWILMKLTLPLYIIGNTWHVYCKRMYVVEITQKMSP